MLKWFASLLNCIRGWWRNRRRQHSFPVVVVVDSSNDPSSAINAGKLVLVGTAEKPKWLRFRCPCRCGDVIAINLMASHSPRWAVELHADGTLTVFPSVDSTTCKSHFWIRRSKIIWVGGYALVFATEARDIRSHRRPPGHETAEKPAGLNADAGVFCHVSSCKVLRASRLGHAADSERTRRAARP